MPEKTQPRWTVEEVYRSSAGETLVKVVQTGSYEPTEWRPKVGQTLTLAEDQI